MNKRIKYILFGCRTIIGVIIEQIVFRVVHRIEQAFLRAGYQPFDEREHVLAIQEEHV